MLSIARTERAVESVRRSRYREVDARGEQRPPAPLGRFGRMNPRDRGDIGCLARCYGLRSTRALLPRVGGPVARVDKTKKRAYPSCIQRTPVPVTMNGTFGRIVVQISDLEVVRCRLLQPNTGAREIGDRRSYCAMLVRGSGTHQPVLRCVTNRYRFGEPASSSSLAAASDSPGNVDPACA